MPESSVLTPGPDPFVALHAGGGFVHLLIDAALSVGIGVAVVVAYLLALRWLSGDRSGGTRSDGPTG